MTRIGVRAFVAAVVVAVAGGIASADGFGSLPQDRKPQFGAYDMAISQEGLPEGWKMQPAGAPSDDAKAINAEAKAATEAAKAKASPVERIATTADGKTVSLVLLDADEEGIAFAKEMETRAGAKGWTLVRLGTPWRLLVVAGPEPARKAAVDAQVRYAAKMLGVTASSAIEARRGTRALAYALGAAAIDPKNATAQYILGRIALEAASREEGGIKFEDAVPRLRAALDKEAHEPLTGEETFHARHFLGDALLQLKNADSDKEARDLYKTAMAASKDADRPSLLGLRYNLACAHARLKELDDAFTHLTAVLEEDKKETVPGIQHWPKDPDFENLKADPRWKTLLEKFPPPAGGGDDGGN